MFLFNIILAHGLSDSGATRSFESLALSKKFGDTPGMFDFPLDVEIADDCIMRAPRVHQGCVLEFFYKKYLIDLVLFPLQGAKIKLGIDWLS